MGDSLDTGLHRTPDLPSQDRGRGGRDDYSGLDPCDMDGSLRSLNVCVKGQGNESHPLGSDTPTSSLGPPITFLPLVATDPPENTVETKEFLGVAPTRTTVKCLLFWFWVFSIKKRVQVCPKLGSGQTKVSGRNKVLPSSPSSFPLE